MCYSGIFPTTAGTSLLVRFTSWNVKGLGRQIKKSKVFAHLRCLKSEVVFLQETHLCTNDHMLHSSWVNQDFHSNFNSKFRGVAILIHNRGQFTPTNVLADKNWQYLIVSSLLLQHRVTLVNIYAPNFNDPGFVDTLLNSIPFLNPHMLI